MRKLKTIHFTNHGPFYTCSEPGEHGGGYVSADDSEKLLKALVACHKSMMLGCQDVEAQILFEMAIYDATEED